MVERKSIPSLVVATGNPGKLREMQSYFPADGGWRLALKPAEIEVEETGETFVENACLKASQVAQATEKWAIADDSGLMVDALGGAPGIYSARYGKSDEERIQRLLRELGDTSQRQAKFVCALAVAQPNGEIAISVEGVCPGEILQSPRGTEGFGYDPIFYFNEAGMTFAEMPPDMKKRLSHRSQAFAKLLPQLSQLFEHR
ncbi:RdgB/HAM1 family non-canonical purine NTP pyrophosphatase [Geitlerinema sp. PCC 9228]|jgi:XTP/dITP diphosphohydrolase|uniref:RdgB/HAM1 family non-canonical purine NTP pyrophosphatase n=1 Tax=Geitlerinema sp. PCC 9228 TaxID=111611 RepID=UPI0008F9A521|nr:RdgB/HAM1 family non-canonical purine NTP pyrophosphatase [Geitlerinema sp. PCC 9228]